MRILFSTGALYGLPPGISLHLAAAAGCDGIELVLDPWTIALGATRMRRMCEGYGLPVAVLHPSLFALPGWTDAEVAFGRLAQYALDVGCAKVVLHPPRPNRPGTSGFDRGLVAMKKIAGDSVTPMVENVAVFHPGDVHHWCVWPEQVARFAESRNLQMTLDTTHLASTRADLVSSYDAVHSRVAHVHLSDFRVPNPLLDRPWLDTYVKHHRAPGDGDLDITGFVACLCRRGYTGDITLELSPLALRVWQPWRSVAVLRRSVELVRNAAARAECAMAAEATMASQPVDATLPVGA